MTTGFPSAYPGHEDGEDTALNAETELAMREHWDDSELRTHLSEDGYDLTDEPPALTLPDAVDLMLRAYWTRNSKLQRSLEVGDFLHAATLVRTTTTPLTRSGLRRSPSSLAANEISLRWNIDNYSLNRQIGQPVYTLLGCEAAGMVPQLARVAHPRGASVLSGGGFDSLTAKHDLAQEIARATGQCRSVVEELDLAYPKVGAEKKKELAAARSGLAGET